MVETSFLGVLFGTYRRRHGYVPLRRLGIHWNVVECFIWDFFETSWRRTDVTSLLRPFETSLRRSNKMSWRRTTENSWRRSIETLLGVSFGTYMRNRWDVQRDVVTASPWRLIAGWENLSLKYYGHEHFVPNLHNLILCESLLHVPRDGESSVMIWYCFASLHRLC